MLRRQISRIIKLNDKSQKESGGGVALSLVDEEKIKNIAQLTSISREIFNQYFYPLLQRVCLAIRKYSVDGDRAVLKTQIKHENWLDLVADVLRYRRSCILPLRCDAETAAELEDLYTYAIVCALALDAFNDRFWLSVDGGDTSINRHSVNNLSGFGLAFLSRIVDEEGWFLLKSHHRVLSDFISFFTDPGKSDIFLMMSAIYSSSEKSKEDEYGYYDFSIKENKTPPKELDFGKNRAKGWDFVDFVHAAVRNKDITVNRKGSMLYFADNGSLLLSEEAIFKWYEEKTQCSKKTSRSRFRRLAIVELTRDRRDRFTALLPDGCSEQVMIVSAENAARYFGLTSLLPINISIKGWV